MRKMEIRCSGCGEVALVRPEPVYEGFKKTGEAYICTSCGKRYASAEETPFADAPKMPQVFTDADREVIVPKVFTDADREVAPKVFDDSERQHCCGWCRHLVLSPFGQRCGKRNRFTEATDVCEAFEKKDE